MVPSKNNPNPYGSITPRPPDGKWFERLFVRFVVGLSAFALLASFACIISVTNWSKEFTTPPLHYSLVPPSKTAGPVKTDYWEVTEISSHEIASGTGEHPETGPFGFLILGQFAYCTNGVDEREIELNVYDTHSGQHESDEEDLPIRVGDRFRFVSEEYHENHMRQTIKIDINFSPDDEVVYIEILNRK